jgi:hypothetical protein
LKVATTTTTKVRTRWFNAKRRRLEDLVDRGKKEIALTAIDTYPNAIARRSKRNKNSLPTGMGQSEAAGKNSFHLDFESFVYF